MGLHWLFLLPTWQIVVLEIVVFAALTMLVHALVRRLVPYPVLAKHNDITGFLLAIVGPIYAVLLAFVVILAWESFDAANRTAIDEAAAASALYRLADSFPDPQRSALRGEILHYGELIEREEWPAMQTGGDSEDVRTSGERISRLAVEMVNAGPVRHTAVENTVMSLAVRMHDGRLARLSQNREGVPPAVWVGLILGAMVTIGFTYLFGVENFRLHLVLTGLLAVLIAVNFAMIVALDYPYRGATSISPEIWGHLGSR